MWAILAYYTPLHLPLCHAHANNNDRVVWAEVEAGSFIRHDSLARAQHHVQRVLQGSVSSNVPVPPGSGTPYGSLYFFCIFYMIPHSCEEDKVKIIVLIVCFLLGTLLRSARRATTLMIKLRGRQKAAQIMPSRPIHRHGCVRQAAPRNLVRCNL